MIVLLVEKLPLHDDHIMNNNCTENVYSIQTCMHTCIAKTKVYGVHSNME